MAVILAEEIKYSAQIGSHLTRVVDITVYYDASYYNADQSFNVTGASGTYKTYRDGVLLNASTITGISPISPYTFNDNRLYTTADPNANPIFNYNGIAFSISDKAYADDGQGNVRLFDSNGSSDHTNTRPTDTPDYRQSGTRQINDLTVDDVTPCFVSGTLISVVRGGTAAEIAVEHLVLGDHAVTASGSCRPITWLGHRNIDCRQRLRPHDAHPVRIAAHAFAPNQPSRDLFVSPGHPILVGADEDGAGGHLVPIMCLINGTTIERVAVDEVTYWHVELDQHDILLAEGLPAESYLDWGDRPFFTEGADHALANPDFVAPGLAGRCRPVAIDGPVVEAERQRLDVVFAMRLVEACAWPDAQDAAFLI